MHLAEVPHLEVLVEGGVPDGAGVSLDEVLQRLNDEYRGKRSSDRYAPPRVAHAPAGTFDRWRAARVAEGVADGQLKDRIIVDAPTLERLRAGWP